MSSPLGPRWGKEPGEEDGFCSGCKWERTIDGFNRKEGIFRDIPSMLSEAPEHLHLQIKRTP